MVNVCRNSLTIWFIVTMMIRMGYFSLLRCHFRGVYKKKWLCKKKKKKLNPLTFFFNDGKIIVTIQPAILK